MKTPLLYALLLLMLTSCTFPTKGKTGVPGKDGKSGEKPLKEKNKLPTATDSTYVS